MMHKLTPYLSALGLVLAVSISGSPVAAQVSGEPLIAAWGDSLTAGAGADEVSTRYPELAQLLLGGIKVVNLGVGGQTSSEIAGRMGAVPVKVELGMQIGSMFDATSVTPNILRDSGILRGEFTGTYEGYPASLLVESGKMFLRTEARDIPSDGVFLPDIAVEYGNRPAWIWAGRNNSHDPEQVIQDIALMVARLGDARFFVMGIITASTDDEATINRIREINAKLKSIYGDQFKDTLSYLLSRGDGSDADRADIARGVVPGSLRSDNIHLNSYGYTVIASSIVMCWTSSVCPLDW